VSVETEMYLKVSKVGLKTGNFLCDASSSKDIIIGLPTAAAPAKEVEAVVRSPTNMATAEIAAIDFNKMTSK